MRFDKLETADRSRKREPLRETRPTKRGYDPSLPLACQRTPSPEPLRQDHGVSRHSQDYTDLANRSFAGAADRLFGCLLPVSGHLVERAGACPDAVVGRLPDSAGHRRVGIVRCASPRRGAGAAPGPAAWNASPHAQRNPDRSCHDRGPPAHGTHRSGRCPRHDVRRADDRAQRPRRRLPAGWRTSPRPVEHQPPGLGRVSRVPDRARAGQPGSSEHHRIQTGRRSLPAAFALPHRNQHRGLRRLPIRTDGPLSRMVPGPR